jgi:hypothetical protein
MKTRIYLLKSSTILRDRNLLLFRSLKLLARTEFGEQAAQATCP